MTAKETVLEICQKAKNASRLLSVQSTEVKNAILLDIAASLMENCDKIITANKKDLASAAENGVPSHMLDRLMLNEARIKGIADSLSALVGLKDPVGSGESWTCSCTGRFAKSTSSTDTGRIHPCKTAHPLKTRWASCRFQS